MPDRTRPDAINPYIALADVYMNLGVAFVIFALLFMLLGHRGWDDVRYRQEHEVFARSVRASRSLGKVLLQPRNDAPGEQRWMFPSSVLFRGDSTALTADGHRTLGRFARLLLANSKLWWRIRVEAHSRQMTRAGSTSPNRRAFSLTALRAVEVSMYLQDAGLDPWRIVASGRGYQDLVDRRYPNSIVNDRVDILLLPPSVQERNRHTASRRDAVPPTSWFANGAAGRTRNGGTRPRRGSGSLP